MDGEIKRCQLGLLDYIELSGTNQIVKFSNLQHRCPPPPPPGGGTGLAGCNMISLHKDVSGV